MDRPERRVLRRTRASPKSAILTRHLSSSRMFGLFRSRCKMGCARECRYCIPLATETAT